MPARHRLRLPAIDDHGNRIGSIVLSYRGELPADLEVRFAQRRAKTNPWSLEPDAEEAPEADPDYLRESPEEETDAQAAPAASPLLKRTWCGQPFAFLGEEPTGSPPKELIAAAKTYTKDGTGRLLVIGAWDGRWVVPMFDAIRGSASVFLIDPVCALRDDFDPRSVPAATVVQTLDANMRRCAPANVAVHHYDRSAVDLGRTIDRQDADLIVIAAGMPDANLTLLAEAWGQHLRPGGSLLGFGDKRQAVDQDNLVEAFRDLGLDLKWNPEGTVWRAMPAVQ